MENNTQQTEKYKIIKFRKSGTQKVLLTNLSLNEARMYCSRPDTKGKIGFVVLQNNKQTKTER
jgi:hypothetical protein